MHTPNRVPGTERTIRVLAGIFLFVYGAIGLWMDDIYLPGKRGPGVHLHGPSAWVMAGAMLCGAAASLAVVIDHYDRRANEAAYRRFGLWSATIGWLLFSASLSMSIGTVTWSDAHLLPTAQHPTVAAAVLAIGIAFTILWHRAQGRMVGARPATESVNPVPTTEQSGTVTAARAGRALARLAGLLTLVVGGLALGLALTAYLARFPHVTARVGTLGMLALMTAHVLLEYARAGTWLALDRPAAKIVSAVLALTFAALLAYTLFGPPASPNWSQARWRQSDEVRRQKAPGWEFELDHFKSGTTVGAAEASLRAAGFEPDCYGNLMPGERLRPNDTHICFAIVHDAWGQPAYMALLAFGAAGMHSWKIDFDGSAWPGVAQYLDSVAQRIPGTFGRDAAGNPLQAWWTRESLIVSAPTRSPKHWGTVLRLLRSEVIQEVCDGKTAFELDRQTIARIWPDSACGANR